MLATNIPPHCICYALKIWWQTYYFEIWLNTDMWNASIWLTIKQIRALAQNSYPIFGHCSYAHVFILCNSINGLELLVLDPRHIRLPRKKYWICQVEQKKLTGYQKRVAILVVCGCRFLHDLCWMLLHNKGWSVLCRLWFVRINAI